MNYKERGYLFQDIFSSLIVFRYVNKILSGEKINTQVVLDKKNNKNDKFDDLKIIEDSQTIEIQLKHRELKERLDLEDFSNYSGDFNLYKFIKSYKSGANINLCLIISLKKVAYEDELKKYIELDKNNALISSERYKFKDNQNLIDLLYKNRLSTIKNPKIDYSDITKEDIKKFINIFHFEVTDVSFVNGCIKNMVFQEISDDIEKISNIPKQVIYNDMIETIREYRAEDSFETVSIKDITNKWLDRLKLMNYTIPVNNDLLIDYNCLISRKKDIDCILKMFDSSNLIHIYGPPGVGKSWFSKELTDELDRQNISNSTYYFYFNTEDIDRGKRLTKYNFVTTFNYSLQKLHGYNISIFNLNFEQLVLDNDDKEHYLIFDGLDHIIRENDSTDIDINELINDIRVFAEKNKNIKILVLSQPLENISFDKSYELTNLDEKSTDRLIEMYSVNYNFPLKKLKEQNFYLKSSGNPLLLKYMIMDYIYNGNVVNVSIKSLNDYYEMIFKGNQFSIYMYFAVLKFPVTIEELQQISSVSYNEIKKELTAIRNVLLINEKNEYIVFHESLRRYLLSLKNLNKEKLINDVINWFKSIDLYSNSKKFNYYPEFVLENNKYESYNELFNYKKMKISIIQNAYSNSEVHDFIKNNYKISQLKEDFNMMYYLEHFYDIYTTFLYDFDINIFENYIYMLYYLGEYDLLRKLIYTKGLSEYSNFDEQWKYIRKVLLFLMKNKFDLKYNNVINYYFGHHDSKEYLKIGDILIPDDSENYRLISEYLKYNDIKNLKDIDTNINPTSRTFDIINSLINDKKGIFIEIFYKKGIYVTKGKKVKLEVLNEKLKNEKYISSLNNLFLLLNYIFDNKDKKINEIFSRWNYLLPDIPIIYRFICEFTKILIDDNVIESELDIFFNKYTYSELCFNGHLSNYNGDDFNFIGNLIIKNNNRDLIIKKFMEFREKNLNDSSKHYDDGITSTLSSIYYQIIYNIKYESAIIEHTTLEEILITHTYQQSNISEFEDNLNNYILGLISGEHNAFYFDNIIKYMFSYGSYRDIQIWELEDILSRLIISNRINLTKFVDLVVISYNAVDRMDRAKDVWHIPNELIKKYSNQVSSIDALNVFFSLLETFNYDIRDKDDLFVHLYENINGNETKKLKFIYYYWRFINRNLSYQFQSNDTELKKCIRYSNKREFNFIRNNVLEAIRNGEYELKYDLILKKFTSKKSIINYIEVPPEIVKNSTTLTNSVEYQSFKELIMDINQKYVDCRNLDYSNLIDNIKKINNHEEIYDLFINMNNSYDLYHIYEVLEKHSFDYSTIDEDIAIELLVGIYYRSNGYVSNMAYDEIYEKALKISSSKAFSFLRKYVLSDNNVTLGRKSGKIFKYLIDDNSIEDIYKDVIDIYLSRLPNFKTFDRYWDISSFDKNDVLLNYFLIKLMNSHKSYNVSVTEEMILIKLFELKKLSCNKLVYMDNNDGNSMKYIIEFLKMYHSVLRINYQAFLNYKKINSFNYIKFQMNDNKTDVIIKEKKFIDDELDSLLVNNHRGFVAIESDNVYKYNANMCQDFGDEILDRYIKYKNFSIYRVSFIGYLKNKFISKIQMHLNFRKIKKIIKKSLYYFNECYIMYMKVPSEKSTKEQ